VLAAYVLVQQIESNVIVPLVMSQTVRLHPAVIAIGVVLVAQLFGFVGLFVAVPILSLLVISVEEFWVKPIEEADRDRRRPDIALPPPRRRTSPRPRSRSGQLRDRYHGAGQHEDHDQDLEDDPVARHVHRDHISRAGPAGCPGRSSGSSPARAPSCWGRHGRGSTHFGSMRHVLYWTPSRHDHCGLAEGRTRLSPLPS
jgi:AI-2E family transporter